MNLLMQTSAWPALRSKAIQLSRVHLRNFFEQDPERFARFSLRYGDWLKRGTDCSDADLSPIHQEFRRVTPIYLQAGGKEILVDMIRDFARTLQTQGAQVRLDVWDHMTHEFHAYGDTLPQSAQAIACIRAAIAWATAADKPAFPATARTEVDGLALQGRRAA